MLLQKIPIYTKPPNVLPLLESTCKQNLKVIFSALFFGMNLGMNGYEENHSHVNIIAKEISRSDFKHLILKCKDK